MALQELAEAADVNRSHQSSAGRPHAEAETTAEPDSGTVQAMLETILGVAAAACTTASYVPQVAKVWRTRETDDLSLRMLLLLATGLGFWVGYGAARGDIVIVAANAVSVTLVGIVLMFKLRETS